MPKQPSMIDVAQLAGVSHVTVSRVLNGFPPVRPATRARVEAAIASLGYRRNSIARALKIGRTATIGVVIAGSELFELPAILLGVESQAKAAGYWVNLASWQGGGTEDLDVALNRLTDQAVEAIAIIADRPFAVDALTTLNTAVPTVVVMSGQIEGSNLGFVELNQQLGARLAVEHLLGLGHREVVHFSGDLHTYDGRARVEGWRIAMAQAGIADPRILTGDFSAASGFELATELIQEGLPLPTAILAGNDHMAMGVLAAFAQHGIRVPEDVSLVGFDDMTGADFLVPALTTIRQDFAALGSRSIRLLLEMLDGGAPSVERLAPELMVRSSTQRPRD